MVRKVKDFNQLTLDAKIERWENVVRVLTELPPHEKRKHFDMANWGVTNECGTVACAAGHCGLDPWFNKQGLKLLPYDGIENCFLEDLEMSEALGEFANGVDVADFFGTVGSVNIFFNTNKRSVGKVIQECKAHIKYLNKKKILLAKNRLEQLKKAEKEINAEYDELEMEIG